MGTYPSGPCLSPRRPISSYLYLGNHVLGNIELQFCVPPLHVLQLLIGVLQVNPQLGLHVLDLFPALRQVLRLDKPSFNLGRAQSQKSAAADGNRCAQQIGEATLRPVHVHRPTDRRTCTHIHTLWETSTENSLLASRKAGFLYIFRFSKGFPCLREVT